MKNKKISPQYTKYDIRYTRRFAGFTLIELLIAASLVGIVSIVSVKLLFTTVVGKARQESIQMASQDVQVFVDLLTSTVKQAKRVTLASPTEISTEGSVCRAFRLNGDSIEMAEDASSGCLAPTTGFTKLTNENNYVESLVLTKNDYEVEISISGYTKDSFGKHEFSYDTTVVKRTD